MRAFAARARLEAGVLTASFVPKELQVADIGTKPLGDPKLLGLLGLVNVRLQESRDEDSIAAKAVGRLGTGGVSAQGPSAPALALAMATLACLPGASAQPTVQLYDSMGMFRWLFQVVVLVSLGVWIAWKDRKD